MLQCKIRDTSREMSSLFKIIFLEKLVHCEGLLIPLFETSGDIHHFFKTTIGLHDLIMTYHHLRTMDSSADSPVCDGRDPWPNSLSVQRSQHQVLIFHGCGSHTSFF